MLFLYRLALQLGIWDVDGLAEAMSVEQLYGWMAAFQLMPFGDEWLRDAVRMAQMYNANRPKNAKAMVPQDFLPVENRANKAQTPDDMWRMLTSIPGSR